MKLYRLVALLGLACLAPQILHAAPAETPAAARGTLR